MALKFCWTGAIFNILWPQRRPSKDYRLAATHYAGIIRTLFMILLDPPEMQLNPCCSLSADTLLVEELYSILDILLTVHLSIIYFSLVPT